jgi:AcrR family transcriptional regulator
VPRSGEATRERILESAYTAFRRRGYARVSMDEIAAAAGVTKRSVYHHFRSKDDLLAAVLTAQHELSLAAFRTFGDGLAGSPEAIVEALFAQLEAWADRPRWAGSGFTRAAVELADLPGHPARAVARRHKAALETELREVLRRSGIEAADEIAREIWLLSEGAISLMLVHADPSYAEAGASAARRLLAARREAPERDSAAVDTAAPTR